MKLLEDKILEQGRVLPGNILKVDSFINHRMDTLLFCKMGEELYRLFKDDGVTQILTIEASGIGIASVVSLSFNVPVVFAKKHKSKNLDGEFYVSRVESFTHGGINDIIVSKKYISKDDRVLIIDDFLASGNALVGLIDIVKSAGAHLVGAGIAIEKGYQGGGDMLRSKGIRVESLAIVESMDGDSGEIIFRR